MRISPFLLALMALLAASPAWSQTFRPVPSDGVARLDALVDQPPPGSDAVAVVGDSTLVLALALEETGPLVQLEITAQNASSEPVELDFSPVFLLVDGQLALRRLSRTDATQQLLGAVVQEPAPRRQERYRVRTQRLYPGRTESTVEVEEQPSGCGGLWLCIATGVLRGERRAQNRSLREAAEYVDQHGLEDEVAVPPRGAVYGTLYWRRPDYAVQSYTVRLGDFDIVFRRDKR